VQKLLANVDAINNLREWRKLDKLRRQLGMNSLLGKC